MIYKLKNTYTDRTKLLIPNHLNKAMPRLKEIELAKFKNMINGVYYSGISNQPQKTQD